MKGLALSESGTKLKFHPKLPQLVMSEGHECTNDILPRIIGKQAILKL